MQEKLVELIPLIVVMTGVVASIFAYRQAERQKAPAPSLHAIGGALASEGAARIHAEELQKIGQSLDRVAESNFAVAKAARESASQWKGIVEEIQDIRRAMQDIAAVQRNPRH